ncbi:MAG TPA: VOC family protein [Acidimicrobiales bacterium]|nr:VOC family protein [Acidimicrobiales bacterium]
MVRVDHVVYGVLDLSAAGGRLADLGLPSVEGGRHPQFGTENRIAGLGDCYLELLAGPPIAALLAGEDDRLLGWMVRTDDIVADARRIGLDVLPMSRETPDGEELRWRLAGFGLGGPMPVFIQWDTLWTPGGDARLVRLEVPCDADRLREWVGGASLPVRCVGESGRFAAEIATADGRSVRLA